tara:strand:- start:87 stop:1385 length:1299 start_codon:yes stop_codon:yes gene_type:complete
MKKILAIIFLSLSWCTFGHTQFIEFEKCLPTAGAAFVFKSWSESEWNKYNTFVKVSKDPFLKNYKSIGLDKIYKKDYISIFAEEYPELNYIALRHTDYHYPEKFRSKLISLNAEFLQKSEKSIYSIDTNSGTITHIRINSEPYLEFLNDYYKKKGRIYDFMRKKTKTTKWIIDSYAGGIIHGFRIYETGSIAKDSPITIDIKNQSISYNFGSDDESTTYVCKNLTSNSLDETSVVSGTAFFINSSGNLLTNNHVIEGCELSKVSYNNKDYNAKLIATDKKLDLALLKTNIRSSTFFSFSKGGANKLNKIYVAGFPLGKGLSDDLKISSGIVSALKGFEDNSNEIQIDAPINPGNSGGPIINESGELVAIAVSGLAKDQTEGINFGIKSSAAESFLNSNKIKPKKSLYSRKLNNDKLLDILEKGTVYTYCNSQ